MNPLDEFIDVEELKKVIDKFSIIIKINKEGLISYINDFGVRFFGFKKSELIGKSINGTIVPKTETSGRDLKRLLTSIFKNPEGYEKNENENIRKNGEMVWVSWTNRAIRDDENNLIGILAIGNDITGNKQSQEKLKESEEKYRSILENTKEGYFEVDLKGNFTYLNDSFCEMIQYSREDLIGTNYSEYTDEENKKIIFRQFNKAFKKQEDLESAQLIFKKKNLRKVIIETSVYLKYDSKENINGFSGLTRDITKLKRAEQKLKKSEQNYKEAFNRANMFKDIIIHDVNNLLQIIQSSSEIYKISAEIEDKNEMVELIKKNVDRGIKLVRNARKLSQIEDPHITLGKVNLNKVLMDSLDFLNNTFQERIIDIEIDDPRKTVYLKANELLSDVFENILFNAVKYSETPTLNLEIIISKIIEKNLIKLEFKDNGIGVENSRKEAIFEKGSEEKSGEGMGLGLSLVKKIISTFKGKIWVEDRIKGDHSKGSNFIILIPEFKK